MYPRSARVALTINGRTAPIMPESFTFVDVASGSSDHISIQVNDRSRKWINGWFPVKGDYIKATIVTENWDKQGREEENFCGTFYVDDFSFDGGPIMLTMNGVAYPASSGWKSTERTQTYENTTLEEIGKTLASRNGIRAYYAGPKISIAKVSQDSQTDSAFYNDLCKKFGMSLKVFNNTITVNDEGIFEGLAPVATLTEKDIQPDWSYTSSTDGVYTGIKYQYNNGSKDNVYTVTVGGGKRIMTLNTNADNLTEATFIALAAINDANKNATRMTCTMVKADRKIVATRCVQIKGLGKLSGKYFVEQVESSIGGQKGYIQKLTLRKVEKRFTKADTVAKTTPESKKQETAPSSPAANYTYATVRYGSRGSTVRIMQQKLTAKGYSLPRYGCDGIFGSETRSAVMAFQRNNGLTVDGICGPYTWGKLLA